MCKKDMQAIRAVMQLLIVQLHVTLYMHICVYCLLLPLLAVKRNWASSQQGLKAIHMMVDDGRQMTWLLRWVLSIETKQSRQESFMRANGYQIQKDRGR